MFQQPAYKTPLVWNRSSSDLLEVLIALHRSNAISLTTGPIAQKDLIDLFSRFLNKPLKYSNQSISALKRRKKPETSYRLSYTNNTDSTVMTCEAKKYYTFIIPALYYKTIIQGSG